MGIGKAATEADSGLGRGQWQKLGIDGLARAGGQWRSAGSYGRAVAGRVGGWQEARLHAVGARRPEDWNVG
jgi:hypothetical protein